MIGSKGASPDILGVEVTPTVVRAIRLNRDDRQVTNAAECPVITLGDSVALDPSTIGPALDEVMHELGVSDRTEHLAAISIGPRRAGVGSGPALPAWLEHRARQLGENMICAGKLGMSFCPQRALDTAIMICEQANITVSRIDFAPVAAGRVLAPGIDSITLGSGRGWRARLRDDEVLEALETSDVPCDDSVKVAGKDGISTAVNSLHGVSLGPGAKLSVETDPGRFAVAVGAALGVIDGSSSNLLDGDTVRGRDVPAAFTNEVGGVDTGEIAGGRTTVNLARGQSEPEARSVIRQVGTVVEPPGENADGEPPGQGAGGDFDRHVDRDADRVRTEVDGPGYGADYAAADASLSADVGTDGPGVGRSVLSDSTAETSPAFDGPSRSQGSGVGTGVAPDPDSRSAFDFGYGSDPIGGRHGDHAVHPDDPIRSFSPEPGAEHSIDGSMSGRGLALVVAGLILFSLAIAIGILVTQG